VKENSKSSIIKVPHESYIVFCKGKSTGFGTAFEREPAFKPRIL